MSSHLTTNGPSDEETFTEVEVVWHVGGIALIAWKTHILLQCLLHGRPILAQALERYNMV